jgi:hypothetical protein
MYGKAMLDALERMKAGKPAPWKKGHCPTINMPRNTPGKVKAVKTNCDLFVLNGSVDAEIIFRVWYDEDAKLLRVEGNLDEGAKQFAKYLAAHFQAILDDRDGL